jgi:hypothetical protein
LKRKRLQLVSCRENSYSGRRPPAATVKGATVSQRPWMEKWGGGNCTCPRARVALRGNSSLTEGSVATLSGGQDARRISKQMATPESWILVERVSYPAITGDGSRG